MDPVTHGITGALLGKGYFSKRHEGVSVFAATLGAVFPDVDVVFEAMSRDPLAIVKYHRAITHSFLALAGVCRIPRLACAVGCAPPRNRNTFLGHADTHMRTASGIASHILLDGMTSFGTRMWTPISQQRVAWDFLFIVDFSFTAIVLLPQVVAWVYRSHAAMARRGPFRMWFCFPPAPSQCGELPSRLDTRSTFGSPCR